MNPSTFPVATIPDLPYPDTDGLPLAESDDHFEEMVNAKLAIRDHFRNRPDVYVAGNLLLYYEEGNPQACVAPDVFVVFGAPKKRRRTYKLWEEGKAPRCVFELTSKSTRLEDLGQKKVVYALLGVREYFLFDPLGEYLKPALQGYHLRGGEYDRMVAGPGGVLESRALGLRLVPEEGHLRLVDRRTGRSLVTPDEGLEGLRRETARAAHEASRAEREASRAEREASRAEREASRARKEAAARSKAEKRTKELEAELLKMRRASTRSPRAAR